MLRCTCWNLAWSSGGTGRGSKMGYTVRVARPVSQCRRSAGYGGGQPIQPVFRHDEQEHTSMNRSCSGLALLPAKVRYSMRIPAKFHSCNLRRQPTTTPTSCTPDLRCPPEPDENQWVVECVLCRVGWGTYTSTTATGWLRTSTSASSTLRMVTGVMIDETILDWDQNMLRGSTSWVWGTSSRNGSWSG